MSRMIGIVIAVFLTVPCFSQTQQDADAARSSAATSKSTSDVKHTTLTNKISTVQSENQCCGVSENSSLDALNCRV